MGYARQGATDQIYNNKRQPDSHQCRRERNSTARELDSTVRYRATRARSCSTQALSLRRLGMSRPLGGIKRAPTTATTA